jgi:hypothetical protein
MVLLKYLKRTVLQLCVGFAVMLVVTIPLMWVHQQNPHRFANLQAIIAQHTFLFVLFRWGIIGLLFCLWSKLIRWRAKRHRWEPERMVFWFHQRLKITLWLILFELLVCENLFLTLIHLLEGR